jgi:ABC-type nitrate/sulfonate/bicarbonate transport system substrate-binding protein
MLGGMLRALGALALVLASLDAAPAAAQDRPLVLAIPGIPPIFAAMIAVVADREGLFQKEGAAVEVKPMESGTAASRALLAGDIDASFSPSPLLAAQISNADADVVGIYGLPSPDFLLASVDPAKRTCKDAVGQPVGVDAVGGARSVALKQMLAACGVALDDVQQIALPSTATTAAMIAGRIGLGVIHLDEVPVLEAQGKPATVITTIHQSNPLSHFAMLAVRRDRLAENREAYVRLTAGIIAAARFMRDPRNADRFAELATVTGRTKDEAKGALRRLLEIDYWPADDDGLDRAKLEAVIATQVKTGAIKPGRTPVTYDRLVDRSVWRDAAALLDRR